MTYKDIYTKFLIEYDKADVTSSYPLLTEYEVATLLDKAYLALIALKVTGNNPRRAQFEADNKAIADIEPLIKHADIALSPSTHVPATNVTLFSLPKDYLYFILTALNYYDGQSNYYDALKTRFLPAELVTHKIAERFFCTPYNMPWVKNPVCYIEDGVVYILYDPINKPMVNPGSIAHLTYIKSPIKFVDSLIKEEIQDPVYDNSDDQEGDNDNPTTPIEAIFRLNISKLNGNDKIK